MARKAIVYTEEQLAQLQTAMDHAEVELENAKFSNGSKASVLAAGTEQ